MQDEIVQQLAPKGTLRAGINMLNFLLVTGKSANGDPEGVAPDMARAIADRLGVARALHIDFTTAYVEIEATYLVPPGSPARSLADVDRAGNRIAVASRSAYDLWLQRNIRHATLVHAEGFEATFEAFVNGGLEAMASLRPGLLPFLERMPGSRVLDGRFTAVQQSIGVRKGRPQALAFLQQFVDEAKSSGFVAELIARHSVNGLTVAA